MDCVRDLFYHHLVCERPSHTNQQIRRDSTHHAVYAHRTRAKSVGERHHHEDGHSEYFQRRIQAPVAE